MASLAEAGMTRSVKFRSADFEAAAHAGAGACLESDPFASGGHEWSICCYPGGEDDDCSGSMSLFLVLRSPCSKTVRVEFSISVVVGLRSPQNLVGPMCVVFNSWGDRAGVRRSSGCENLLSEKSIELLIFKCSIDVMNGGGIGKRFAAGKTVAVPHSDTASMLERQLDNGDVVDVTFHVGGRRFPAARALLAMRSPVFKTMLYGPMAESGMDEINIRDVEPSVFEALLRFAYTGALPGEALETDASVKALLVAADLYVMDELKQFLEWRLCIDVTLDIAVETLAFAERYNFAKLKDHCLCLLAIPENLSKMAVDDGYLDLMSAVPVLREEVRSKITQPTPDAAGSSSQKRKRGGRPA